MIGAVSYLELLQLHRRGRQRLFCLIYGGWLLAEFVAMYLSYLLAISSRRPLVRIEAASHFINNFVELFVVQQYVLLLLVTPAFVAGTITDEKTRGTLQHLLTTSLTSPEIILGKLVAQLARLLELALLGLPLLCFVGAVGGVEPGVILAVFLSPLLPLLTVAGASLLASVWCRSTREAVLAVYILGGLAFLTASGISGTQRYLDPRYVLEPAWQDGNWREWGRRWLETGRLWGGLALVCVALATWRLRPSYQRQQVAQSRGGSLRHRPRVTDLPVYWKSRYVDGLKLPPVLRQLPVSFWATVTFILSLIVPMAIVAEGGRAMALKFQLLGLVGALGAGLLMAVRCSGAVTTEREKQTWDALLLTPLEPRQILRSKLLGARDALWPYVLAFALPALPLSLFGGAAAFLWMLFWLWGSRRIMYWMGSCGIACSVEATSSWQSMLSAIFRGYRGLLARFVASLPLGCCLGASVLFSVLSAIVQAADVRLPWLGSSEEDWMALSFLGPLGVMCYSLLWAAEERLQEAEKRVAREERVGQRHRSPLSPEEKQRRRQALSALQFQMPSYPPRSSEEGS
jgi:ABC-type transport system involved in multi-copper enzyme maturation permease subunit